MWVKKETDWSAFMKQVERLNLVALIILIFGFSQMIGYVLDIPPLRGIGAASTIAPFPRVFSDADGIETFALNFILEYRDSGGNPKRLGITPEIYSRLEGPYNRRNVYGAALSYGPTPRFPQRLFNQVFEYAFVEPGPLRAEFGIPQGATDFQLLVTSKTKGRPDHWRLPKEPTSGNPLN